MNEHDQEEYLKRSQQIDKAREQFEEIFLTIPAGIRAASERFVKKSEKIFMVLVIAGLAYIASIESITYWQKLIILFVFLLSMLLNGAQRYEDGKLLRLWEIGAVNNLTNAYSKYKKVKTEEITGNNPYTKSRCIKAFIYSFALASILGIYSWVATFILTPFIWVATVKLLHKHDTSLALEKLTGEKPQKVKKN